MAPKKAKEEPKEEPPPVPEEEEEPDNPEILEKCFRIGGQLFYGQCKAGYKERKGTFVRQGFGRQVELAVAPAGARFDDSISMAYETMVAGMYEGQWSEDKMSGQGKYRWGDGSSYEGDFVDGQMDGQGLFVWPDGSSYEGVWHEGRMHGQGRFESRSYGKVYDGRFHADCFQAKGGEWVDILAKARQGDATRTTEGDLEVRRVPFGAWLRDAPTDEEMGADKEKEALIAALEGVQREGLVPLVVAEEGYGAYALECLAEIAITTPAEHAATVRAAAVAKRRRRDHHRFFFDAIQRSLRSGCHCVVAIEDDDVGTSLAQDEQAEGWSEREPAPSVPSADLPEDWRLSEFYNPAAFPAEFFHPRLFNGRGLARYFLPEACEPVVESPSLPPAPPLPADAAAAPAQGGAAGDAAQPGEEQPPDPATEAAREFQQLASQELKFGMLGQTGCFFSAPPETSAEAAGIPVAYCLRPVVCAHGRVPSGLSDEDLRGAVVKRFGRHVPLHRTVLVVLGGSAEAPPEEPAMLS